MAGIDTESQVGKVEDVADVIFNISAEETPFTSMVKKGTAMAQEVGSFQMEKHPVVGYDGVLDGEDVDSFEGVVRETAEMVCQEFRRPWKVSQRAEVNKVHGLGSAGEKAHQKVLAMVTLKKMMERCFGGQHDCRVQSGADTFRTRSAFSWLSPTAQAVKPVPANFRPAAAAVLSGTTVAAVTEAALNAALNNMYNASEGSKRSLQCLLGTLLKAQFDSFGAVADAGASFATFPVRQLTLDAKEKAMIRVIDRMEFSTAQMFLHLSPFLYTNIADGSSTASTTRSALCLDMDTWELRHQLKPQMHELENQGGGPRGYVNAMMALVCYNPTANTFVQAAS